VSETKIIGQHAASVLVGQLAVMAFGVADTVIAGRYSDTALAALSVGSAIYISVYVGLIGIVQALLPIWAELLGAKRLKEIGRSVRQSIYLCSFITLAGTVALLFPGAVLKWAQVPDAMVAEVKAYLTVLAFAFAPALLFRLYSTLNQSLGRPMLVTVLQVAALCVKIPLSIWFVAGGGSVEPMGAVGCAWATLVVSYLLLMLAVVMLRVQPMYKPLLIWRKFERPDWAHIGQFARLGIPAGLAYFVEITSFTLMALFIARLGTVASASHQIASSVAAVLYMVPLSVSIACSSRASYWLGSGSPEKAKNTVVLGLKITLASAALLASLLATAPTLIANAYSANPEIVSIAGAMLLWVACYHVADALQAICAFLLRCYGITIAPLVVYAVGLWGLGLLGGYQLTYADAFGLQPEQTPVSFWIASTLGITLVASSLAFMLLQAVRKSVGKR
jgi:multidrug resistance protein, MATE family